MLEIRLLGQFAISLKGKSVELASRQAQGLLAYLAMNAGKAERRERLAGFFWPEATEENARTYLRQALWRLRKELGDGYFQADRMKIGFNQEADYWLDTASLKKEPVGGWSVENLIRSVSVYKGELLPGFYNDWVLRERDRYHSLYDRLMETLLDGLFERTAWKDMVTWGERWLATGIAPEQAYRGLMKAHAKLGDLASMTAVYHRCVETLESELGVPPSAETQSLFQQLKQGKSLKPAGSSKIVLSTIRGTLPAFLTKEREPEQIQQAPFVGRQMELEFLEKKLHKAIRGEGGLVFVTGEAGIGKSSLLKEFSNRAQAFSTELIFASGSCPISTGGGVPYMPFREMMAMLLGDVEAAWTAGRVSREHARRLWQLLPVALSGLLQWGPNLIGTIISSEDLRSRAEIASVEKGLLEKLDILLDRASQGGIQVSDQRELYITFTSFLRNLAARQPLLLMVDDLQWADHSSIGLIAQLSHVLFDSRILFVGAYRPEEIDQPMGEQAHAFVGLLSELQRRFGDIVIDLERSLEGEEREFVDELLDAEPNRLDELFRQTLLKHTRGHPLFTIELLRELRELGIVHKDKDGFWSASHDLTWDLLPPRVEGVIKARIDRLDQDLRWWLSVASVEGLSFTAEVVARLMDVDPTQVISRLSREVDRKHHLIRAEGVSRIQGQRLSRYHFIHHLFQVYLFERLDDVERVHLHEQVGAALESLYGEQTTAIAGRLAHHFTEAGLLEKGANYWRQAGENAIQVAAYEEAIDYLQRGLALLGALPATDATRRQELAMRIALGSPYIALKGWAATEVGETYERAFDLCEQIGDVSERFLCIWNLWRFYTNRGELEKAEEHAERVVNIAEREHDSGLRLQAYHARWTTSFYTGEFLTASRSCENGISLYRPEHHHGQASLYGEHDPAVCSHCFQALTLWYLGFPDQGLARSRDAIRLATTLDHPYTLAYALSFAADICLLRGEVGAVEERASAAIEFAVQHGYFSWVSWGKIRKGWALVQQEQLTRGLAMMNEGLEEAETAEQELFRPYNYALMADALWIKGELEEALSFLNRAQASIKKTGERHYEAEVYRLKGELLQVKGASLPVVEKCFRKAMAIARRQSARSWELRTALSLARFWQRQSKAREAYEVLSNGVAQFTEGYDTSDLIKARVLLEELG